MWYKPVCCKRTWEWSALCLYVSLSACFRSELGRSWYTGEVSIWLCVRVAPLCASMVTRGRYVCQGGGADTEKEHRCGYALCSYDFKGGMMYERSLIIRTRSGAIQMFLQDHPRSHSGRVNAFLMYQLLPHTERNHADKEPYGLRAEPYRRFCKLDVQCTNYCA
jgi:hypothetical protein